MSCDGGYQRNHGNDAGTDDRRSVLQTVTFKNEVEEWLKHGCQGEEPQVLFLDFFVQVESEKYRREKDSGDNETQEDGSGGVEVLIDLCRPNKRNPPEDHGDNTCEVNNICSVFHAAKLQFFEIVFL